MNLLKAIKDTFSYFITEKSTSSKEILVPDNLDKQPLDGIIGDSSNPLDNKFNSQLWTLVSQVQRLSNDKLIRCQDYNQMSKDGTIGSALEMMADDASQPDDYTNKSIWISSAKDEKLASELNNFIDNIVKIESRVWNWCYNIATYGELYLKTFYVETFANRRKKFMKDNNLNEEDIQSGLVNKKKLVESVNTQISDLSKRKLTEGAVTFLLENFTQDLNEYNIRNTKSSIKFIDEEADKRLNRNKNCLTPLESRLVNFIKSNVSNSPSQNAEINEVNLVEEVMSEGKKSKPRKDIESDIDADEFYFEEVSPEDIYHLFFKGLPCGYIVLSDISSVKMIGKPQFYPEGEYIHFIADRYWFKDDLIFRYQDPDSDELITRKYSVKSGSSFIDKARMPYRIMKLLDDILLITRLSRSSTFIVHFIEVQNAGAQETIKMLKEYRNAFKSNEKFSVQEQLYSSTSSPVPQNDHIFMPSRNGKGVSTFQRVGGDVEFSNMVDVDYFRNKLYGSIKVPKCVRGNTKVLLCDGRAIPIREIAENNAEYIGKCVYTCSPEGKIEATKIKACCKTRLNAEYVRITLDNGKYVDVTPDHNMILRNGEKIHAEDLKPGDSLMPLYLYVDGKYWKNYLIYKDNKSGQKLRVHRMVAESFYGKEGVEGKDVHHKDKNRFNNDISNLEVMTRDEHLKSHGFNVVYDPDKNKSFYKRPKEHYAFTQTEEFKKKQSEAAKGKKRTEETKKRMSAAWKGKPSKNPYKKGEANIAKDPIVREKMKNGRKEFFDKGGKTWNTDIDKTSPEYIAWQEKIAAYNKAKSERNGVILTIECSCCGKEFQRRVFKGKVEHYFDTPRFCEVKCQRTYQATKNCEAINQTKKDYNHKVVSVEPLNIREDAYNLEVENAWHTYFLEAGVAICNSFLGFEEEVPGSLGNTSLVRLDLRYARTIKGIKKSVKNGVRRLCEFYLMVTGRKVSTCDFEVNMANVISAEESDRVNELTTRLQLSESLNNVVTTYEDYIDKKKTVMFLIKDILKISKDIFKDEKELKKIKIAPNPDEGETESESPSEEGKEDSGESATPETSDFPTGKLDSDNIQTDLNPSGPENASIDVETSGDISTNSMWN